MKISVIIPVYNNEKFVRESVESAVNQTLQPDEIILIDDGSTDNTNEILDELSDEYSIVSMYRVKHGGIGHAINEGIKKSTGDIICWLSSDDIWKPEKLETQKIVYDEEKNKDKIIFSDWEEITEFGDTTRVNRYPFFSTTNFRITCNKSCVVNFSTIWIPRSIIEKVGLFPTKDYFETNGGEDYYWLLRSIRLNIDYVHIPVSLVKYRVHDNMLTKKVWGEVKENERRIKDRIEKEFGY